MERTTVYMDEETRRLLKQAAKRRKIPEAQIIREALREHLQRRRTVNPRVVGRSRDGGVARRLDEALEETGFGRSVS